MLSSGYSSFGMKAMTRLFHLRHMRHMTVNASESAKKAAADAAVDRFILPDTKVSQAGDSRMTLISGGWDWVRVDGALYYRRPAM